jgi:two-component sensor histidine kinase
MLVVLTTFAINMLTATGDLNKILVRWSHLNNESQQHILQYEETGEQQYLDNYFSSKDSAEIVALTIDELMSGSPDEELIFREISPSGVHPNEISGLIRIFSLFSESAEVRHIKQTWFNLREKASSIHDKNASLYLNEGSENSTLSAETSETDHLMFEVHSLTREMISGNSAILLLLKRYSLWFTVLLGIIIVVIGIIFTVRGVKQLKKLQNLLDERDYLAMFPELNQYPVLNVTKDGEVGFINQAARNLFPDLEEKGLQHPFLSQLRNQFDEITSGSEKTDLSEVHIRDKYYQQAFHYLSEESGIHIHSIDITELKEQQFEIKHTLKEKETLLAEVHHRVKNNMAVISSLLELQEMIGENPETALAESRARIKSMAIVHELLYEANSLSEINVQDYLTKIGEHLKLSVTGIDSVHVNQSEDEQHLNINQAVPLGLLLNEITFYLSMEREQQDPPLHLTINITPMSDKMCLQLAANTKTMKNPLQGKNQPTLRMSLIKNLLAQIDGSISVSEGKPFDIKILFSTNVTKGSSSSIL